MAVPSTKMRNRLLTDVAIELAIRAAAVFQSVPDAPVPQVVEKGSFWRSQHQATVRKHGGPEDIEQVEQEPSDQLRPRSTCYCSG
jgi:hypothetical protein